MEILLIWLVFGFAAMAVAISRGGNGFLWLCLGVLLGPLGLAMAFLSGDRNTTCRFCRSRISDSAVRCPKCQADLREQTIEEVVSKGKFCGECGASIPLRHHFCGSCGAPEVEETMSA
jgi:predicted amidophosphoribosyltransferase